MSDPKPAWKSWGFPLQRAILRAGSRDCKGGGGEPPLHVREEKAIQGRNAMANVTFHPHNISIKARAGADNASPHPTGIRLPPVTHSIYGANKRLFGVQRFQLAAQVFNMAVDGAVRDHAIIVIQVV